MNKDNILAVQERIRSGSTVDGTSGCWIWKGCKNSEGYGHLRVGGPVLKAHRVSYEAFFAPLRKKQEVCHRCDNPSCVNPDHLFAGSHSDNMRDMQAKGRRRGGRGRSAPRGSAASIAIFRLRSRGQTLEAISAATGVSRSSVWRVLQEDRP